MINPTGAKTALSAPVNPYQLEHVIKGRFLSCAMPRIVLVLGFQLVWGPALTRASDHTLALELWQQ